MCIWYNSIGYLLLESYALLLSHIWGYSEYNRYIVWTKHSIRTYWRAVFDRLSGSCAHISWRGLEVSICLLITSAECGKSGFDFLFVRVFVVVQIDNTPATLYEFICSSCLYVGKTNMAITQQHWYRRDNRGGRRFCRNRSRMPYGFSSHAICSPNHTRTP